MQTDSETKTLAELHANLLKTQQAIAQMQETELAKLVTDIETRCELLGIAPSSLLALVKKSGRGRGRPRKSDNQNI